MDFKDLLRDIRIPYGIRRIPLDRFARLSAIPEQPGTGDVAAARLEKIGKNTRLELADGRLATLHEGDLLAVVFGNRYATEQFEGYARVDGDRCDLLSVGGLCGIVMSRHGGVAEPSRLRLLGAFADRDGRPLSLRDHALPALTGWTRPIVTLVCGTSMDAGKTHTATSLIVGLRRGGRQVAGIKLTGTAAGRDTWSYADGGARPALDFTDGGLPSTYLCTLQELLDLHHLLLGRAAAGGATHAVIEIADGVLQTETAALLRSREFMATVDQVVFATGDPVGAAGGVEILRRWEIEPVAISKLVSMSPLGMREVEHATKIRCFTSDELKSGALNDVLACADPIRNGGNGVHVAQEKLAAPTA